MRQQPSKARDLPHPTDQANRLVREWLAAGPVPEWQLDRRAAERGLSWSRYREALAALITNRTVTTTRQRDGRVAFTLWADRLAGPHHPGGTE